MKPDDLTKTIEGISLQGLQHPGYYLFGNDEYIKRELIAAVKKTAVLPDFAEFNFDEFWGGDLRNVKTFFDTLMAIPMMAGQRLTVLREAEKAPKDLLKSLEDFQVPQGNLLIVESTPKSKNSSFHKKMVAKLTPFECTVKNDRDMTAWVMMMAGELYLLVT